MACILGCDQSNLLQNPDRPKRDILQVPNRSGNHIKRPRRPMPIVFRMQCRLFCDHVSLHSSARLIFIPTVMTFSSHKESTILLSYRTGVIN